MKKKLDTIFGIIIMCIYSVLLIRCFLNDNITGITLCFVVVFVELRVIELKDAKEKITQKFEDEYKLRMHNLKDKVELINENENLRAEITNLKNKQKWKD